jgi:hypothetical protein
VGNAEAERRVVGILGAEVVHQEEMMVEMVHLNLGDLEVEVAELNLVEVRTVAAEEGVLALEGEKADGLAVEVRLPIGHVDEALVVVEEVEVGQEEAEVLRNSQIVLDAKVLVDAEVAIAEMQEREKGMEMV